MAVDIGPRVAALAMMAPNRHRRSLDADCAPRRGAFRTPSRPATRRRGDVAAEVSTAVVTEERPFVVHQPSLNPQGSARQTPAGLQMDRPQQPLPASRMTARSPRPSNLSPRRPATKSNQRPQVRAARFVEGSAEVAVYVSRLLRGVKLCLIERMIVVLGPCSPQMPTLCGLLDHQIQMCAERCRGFQATRACFLAWVKLCFISCGIGRGLAEWCLEDELLQAKVALRVRSVALRRSAARYDATASSACLSRCAAAWFARGQRQDLVTRASSFCAQRYGSVSLIPSVVLLLWHGAAALARESRERRGLGQAEIRHHARAKVQLILCAWSTWRHRLTHRFSCRVLLRAHVSAAACGVCWRAWAAFVRHCHDDRRKGVRAFDASSARAAQNECHLRLTCFLTWHHAVRIAAAQDQCLNKCQRRLRRAHEAMSTVLASRVAAAARAAAFGEWALVRSATQRQAELARHLAEVTRTSGASVAVKRACTQAYEKRCGKVAEAWSVALSEHLLRESFCAWVSAATAAMAAWPWRKGRNAFSLGGSGGEDSRCMSLGNAVTEATVEDELMLCREPEAASNSTSCIAVGSGVVTDTTGKAGDGRCFCLHRSCEDSQYVARRRLVKDRCCRCLAAAEHLALASRHCVLSQRCLDGWRRSVDTTKVALEREGERLRMQRGLVCLHVQLSSSQLMLRCLAGWRRHAGLFLASRYWLASFQSQRQSLHGIALCFALWKGESASSRCAKKLFALKLVLFSMLPQMACFRSWACCLRSVLGQQSRSTQLFFCMWRQACRLRRSPESRRDALPRCFSAWRLAVQRWSAAAVRACLRQKRWGDLALQRSCFAAWWIILDGAARNLKLLRALGRRRGLWVIRSCMKAWACYCSSHAAVQGLLFGRRCRGSDLVLGVCFRSWAASSGSEAAMQETALQMLHARREKVLLAWERGHEAALRMCHAWVREPALSLKRAAFGRWLAAARAARRSLAGSSAGGSYVAASPPRSLGMSMTSSWTPGSSVPTCLSSPVRSDLCGQIVEAWFWGEAAGQRSFVFRAWAAVSALLAVHRVVVGSAISNALRRLIGTRILLAWAFAACRSSHGRRLRFVGSAIDKRLRAECVLLRTRCETVCSRHEVRALRSYAFAAWSASVSLGRRRDDIKDGAAAAVPHLGG